MPNSATFDPIRDEDGDKQERFEERLGIRPGAPRPEIFPPTPTWADFNFGDGNWPATDERSF